MRHLRRLLIGSPQQERPGKTLMSGKTTGNNVRAASRRGFLQATAVIAGGSAIGAVSALAQSAGGDAANLPPNVPEWMKTPGDPMGGQLYGAPSSYEKGVVKNISKTLPQYISASSRTPLQDLDGIITPNGLFYERHHGGVPDHRSGAAPADAARHGRSSAGVHDGRHQAVSVAIAHPLHRVLRQSRLHETLRQDGVRSGRARQLRRMDRRPAEARAGRSRPAEGCEMDRGRGRRRRGA